nr:hypothetical protein L204_01871 [Cryptococcus depauperatus CBS 7855]
MVSKTRQRTTTRQRQNSEDVSLNTSKSLASNGVHSLRYIGEIIDNQEQQQEINKLRAKNLKDNRQAQNALDVGILTNVFISVIQIKAFIAYPNPIFTILSIFQLILLPLSLTPHWLPSSWLPYLNSASNHLLILSIHLAISICAVSLRTFSTGPTEHLQLGEIARWTLPCLVVGGVDMQRRGERDADQKLRLLETMKYDLRGA